MLLDAAHNPAGAAALASYLEEWRRGDPRPPLVFGTMRDKDVAGMFGTLLPAAGPVILTRASTRRAADPQELAALAVRLVPACDITVEPSPAAALDAAWRRARRIVVAGSIFLLGDVMKVIEGP
jgi:dihydrofolate synthase/folylpolyglutamate synthase